MKTYNPVEKSSRSSKVKYVFIAIAVCLILLYLSFENVVKNPLEIYGLSMPNYACSQKVAYFESNRTDLIPKTGYNGLAALPPFLSTDTHMIFSTRYKIGACLIPKVMSTIMTAVLCYLQDSEAFIKNNRTIPTETYATRFCHDSIENRHMDEWTRRYNRHGEYTTFTFVREPIDRFLSAFVDKCVVEHREKEERFHLDCYGCSEDVACFIYKMKDRIWKYVEGKHSLSVMDIHVIPQTWHCKMKYYMHDFTIFRYVSTSSDDYKVYLTELTDILMKQNVPQDQIYYVMSGLTGGHSPHSTSNSSVRSDYRKKLMSRPDLLKILVDLYYYDFVTFGFPFPNLEK